MPGVIGPDAPWRRFRLPVRRLAHALMVLWAAFTVTFLLLRVLPADAIQIKFQNADLGLDARQIADIRDAYGIDRPLWWQYGRALWDLLRGDFGLSIGSGVPVSDRLAASLPSTLWLAGLGSVLAAILAAIIAYGATLAPPARLRSLFRAIPALFVSLPTFWLGIALIEILSFRLGLLPVVGVEGWRALILPVVTLAVPVSAPLTQVLLRSIDEVMSRPFIQVARAKGAGRNRVFWLHVLRNALPSAMTMAGLMFGELLGGAIVTETVFGLNGIGRLTEEAVNSQDTQLLLAVTMLSATGFVLVNLLVDLLFPLLDPRLSGKSPAARGGVAWRS